MREMKDSGMPWIGKIPKDWKTDKFKYHLKRSEPRNPGNQVVLSLYRDYGIIPKDSRDDNHNVTSEDTSHYKYVQIGDFVVNKMKAWQGSVAVSNYEGIVSPAYYVYKFSDHQIYKKYLHYLLRACYKDEFMRLSGGLRVGQWDLSADGLGNTYILIPPYDEQVKIADYLDSKKERIDSIRVGMEAEIEALKEYKKSVITEAVTNGLNKNVEMKDSGIPWCPRIPKHWVPTNPKALFHQRKERARENDKQLTASQKHGIVFQDDFMKIENQKVVTVAKDFDILKHVEPNDFVISMRSFQGGLEFSELSGCISSAYVMLVPNCNLVYPPFYRWLFKSDKYINAIQSTTNLIRDGQAMRFANFVMVPLFIIPLDEQQRIADYLNKKCSKIDSIIQKKQELLANLDTYKKSLIYEYVTGKKEVPAV